MTKTKREILKEIDPETGQPINLTVRKEVEINPKTGEEISSKVPEQFITKGDEIFYLNAEGLLQKMHESDDRLPIINNGDGSVTYIDRRTWTLVTTTKALWY